MKPVSSGRVDWCGLTIYTYFYNEPLKEVQYRTQAIKLGNRDYRYAETALTRARDAWSFENDGRSYICKLRGQTCVMIPFIQVFENRTPTAFEKVFLKVHGTPESWFAGVYPLNCGVAE